MLTRAALAGLILLAVFLAGTFVIDRDRLADPVTYLVAASLAIGAVIVQYVRARNSESKRGS